MKKIALSVLIIGIFLAYSYTQRHQGNASVVPPVALTTSGNNASQQTQAPSTSTSSNSNTTATGKYKDGTYTGSAADAYYGNVQVQVTIQGGKITSVQFLQHPSDNNTSRSINDQAMPYLQQEAIQAQSAQVNTISGATDTSMAFIQSLTAALAQA